MVSRRALVGKTVMDDPEANPEYYRDACAVLARLSVVEAFWLATACGGEALGLRVLLGAAQPVDGIDAGAGSVGVKVAAGSYDAGTLALPPGALDLIGQGHPGGYVDL